MVREERRDDDDDDDKDVDDDGSKPIKLTSEDLSRYLNKIESLGLRIAYLLTPDHGSAI